MKKTTLILALVFTAFLCTPSIIALIDRNVDISIAYDVNEEESSSKNQISLEYTLEQQESNYHSIQYLQNRTQEGHWYKESRYKVFLSITSPPPKQA
ncbi:hypothetical protein [Christiangramia portivictoriae]|uniref:hypothetical protein n=1 Tax=Christiangramia portivictoriae TaxID=326069 RepID=UPI000479ABD7|nr:hypothetical protein [Christiangramia portivictoriae]